MQFDYIHVVCALLIPGVLYAAWVDFSQRRVPNWLNVTLLVTGLIAQAVYFGWSGLGAGCLGMLVGFGLLIIPWMMHGMGAGDVKLMAAIGAWFGPWATFQAFVVGALLGAVAAMIMILSTGRLRMACANMSVILNKCTRVDTAFSEYGSAKSFGNTTQLLPYGVPLTAGALIVLGMQYLGM